MVESERGIGSERARVRLGGGDKTKNGSSSDNQGKA